MEMEDTSGEERRGISLEDAKFAALLTERITKALNFSERGEVSFQTSHTLHCFALEPYSIPRCLRETEGFITYTCLVAPCGDRSTRWRRPTSNNI